MNALGSSTRPLIPVALLLLRTLGKCSVDRGKRPARLAAALLLVFACVPAARAHDLPFSYLNLHLEKGSLYGTCVVHSVDAGHELQLPPEQLLDPAMARRQLPALARMLTGRIQVKADGHTIQPIWTRISVEGQRLALSVQYSFPGTPGEIEITADLFPYDRNHQTFLNLYDGTSLMEAVLSSASPSSTYRTGSIAGPWSAMRRFVPEGFHHILIGPDHLLFLVALLLRVDTIRRLALIVSMFTLGHSLTLSLAVLGIVTPPARVIEPAIALTIVLVALDTLLKRGEEDRGPWFAFFFGLIHGFGFASVLREMKLPPWALGASLLSFNVGIELAQLLVVCLLFFAFAAVRRSGKKSEMRLRVGGSVAVLAAGVFWFLERLIYPAT